MGSIRDQDGINTGSIRNARTEALFQKDGGEDVGLGGGMSWN